jgi:peptidoglycan/xylan/chitin deacetylase (PgdA/CDA1 family)
MKHLSYYTPILGYHRVGPSRGDHVPTVSATAFERQMSLLQKWRYRVIAFADLVACLDRGEPLPRRAAVITFDDGYEETYTVAWPILRRVDFPATVFVTPNEVLWKGFARWHQITEMSRDSVTIGSHTMNHSYLPALTGDRVAEELTESKRIIESQIGRPVEFLSYPSGGYNAGAQAAARQAGYAAACTTNRAQGGAVDRYALRRIKVTERDAHPLRFLAKVSGYYDAFRRLNQPE